MRRPPVWFPGRICRNWIFPVLATFLLVVPCLAQERAVPRGASAFHPDSSYNAETLLKNAAIHVRERQWSEAIDLYQRVVEQFGDSVAAVPRSDAAADPTGASTLYVNARRFCQATIAALPAEARVVYRERVDARAEQLYREASANSDLNAARKVVEDFFCSSWGDDALNLFGDLAFREGEFFEALSAYRSLVPDEVGSSVIAYPEPEVDTNRVVAKKLLCRAAIGESVPADAVDPLKAAGGDPKVSFAGRTGALAESLTRALEEDHWVRGSSAETRWPTFGGAADRNGHAPDKIDVGSFQWKVDLKNNSGETKGPEADDFRALGSLPRGAQGVDLEPGLYPIVVGDLVVVALEDRVAAFHLNKRPEESKKTDSVRELLAWQQLHPTLSAATRNVPGPTRVSRTTLTASGDRIIARLGPTGRTGGGGILYAMRSNREVEGKLLWRKPASEIPLPVKRGGGGNGAVATFEGTPVADESRVYVALTEAATETWVYVACLDAETGRVIWVRFIGNASSQFDPMRQMQLGGSIGNRLLTLANQTIYYQTNMGAVACLDADSGSLRWLATYPARENSAGTESKRGLNPAICVDGLVVVAPEDSSSLFAFDASSGHLVWKTQPVPQVAHVLGAAKGKLFATGDRVYTFDLATGRVLRAWPEAGLGVEGAGRGLLAGDFVYWPTKTEIVVLDQETGGSINSSIPLSQAFGYGGGNLAVGEGYLVVAQRDRLLVFCQNRRLIERYRLQITENPDRAASYFQLARIAEATNQPREAADGYRQAIQRAQPAERVDGQPLGEEARARLHRLLLAEADGAGSSRDWKKARSYLVEAVDLARTDREKLSTRLKQAEADASDGDFTASVKTLQNILEDERLTRLAVPVDDRRRERADLWIADRLRSMIALNGRAIYAEQDQAAARLLDQGRSQGDARLLAEVGRVYPASRVAPEALRALGEVSERKQQWSEAATAYKRLLSLAESDRDRARALIGLARASEARGDLENARSIYLKAAERFGPVKLDLLGQEGTVASIVAGRLDASDFRTLEENQAGSSLPLERKWVRKVESHWRSFPVGGRTASGILGTLFLANGTRLMALKSTTGQDAWSVDLGQEPVWVSQFGDVVLAATATEIRAFQQIDGQPLWRFDPKEQGRPALRIDPFSRSDLKSSSEETTTLAEPTGRLHTFNLQGTRLYFLRGDQALMCVDAAEGKLEWSYEATTKDSSRTEPRLNPQLLIGPELIVAQLGSSHSVLVLDAATGAKRGEFAREQDQSSWLRPPQPLDDERVLLVIDARTVVLFDLVQGIDVWSYRDDSALPLAAAPRAMVDHGVILILFGGQHLTRLDASSGKRIWSRGVSVEDLSETPAAFALDGTRFYCATPGRLIAMKLEDGSIEWNRLLVAPDGGWAIGIHGPCLVAFPQQGEDPSLTDTSSPLLVIRRDTGQLVQRLVLPSDSSGLRVRLDSDVPLLASQRELWALRPIGSGE